MNGRKKVIGAFIFVAFAAQIGLPACASRVNSMSDNEKAERLAMETGKLTELRDPVEIARSQVTIAGILLDFLARAITGGQSDAIDKRLAQYTNAIQAARNAMVGSGLDPIQQPKGYKILETATREHSQRLLGFRADLNDRESLERARQVIDSIHNEMRSLLSPVAH
jgi:hypothetical protein